MTAEKTLLKCNQCNKEFKYDSERRRHEQSHFPQFQCKVCSKNFSFISALRRHEKQHERTGTVTCNECNRQFRDNVLLKRHIKYAHAGSYICTKCDAVFCSELALRTHMQIHKSESERRYQCSFEGCSKKFNFAHHLKHHELTHTNSKQHYCKICGKGFIQSHHLKAHLKTHCADPSLYCTNVNCKKKFATQYAKKRHIAKYHIKTDSGISSDSNSALDTSNISKSDLTADDGDAHTELTSNTKLEPLASETRRDELVEHVAVDLTTNATENSIDIVNKCLDNDIRNCQTVLGRCIMTAKDEKCVCDEINKNVHDHNDFTPIEAEILSIYKLNINSNNCSKGNCCGGSCGVNDNLLTAYETPAIELKTDGTVKIKEFLGIDDDMGFSDDKNIRNDVKFIPYNSCKAVLGNCIVSGNGTMGDGCLCAKMILDEQVTAQEIEDITPCPKEEVLAVI